MGNYSPLMRNTLDGLSDGAGSLYLKLFEKYQGDERKAFLEACRYEESCGEVVSLMIEKACEISAQDGIVATNPNARRDLEVFFADRWRHNFMKEPTP